MFLKVILAGLAVMSGPAMAADMPVGAKAAPSPAPLLMPLMWPSAGP